MGIQINLKVKANDENGYGTANGSEFQAVNAVLECLETGPKTVYVTEEVSLEEIKQTLIKHFTPKYGDPTIDIEDSVLGKTHEGLTIYIDASEFETQFVDEDAC